MGLSQREWLALWRWGDLSPDEKPHLRYPSVWRWFQAEGVPCPLTLITDPAERERRQREYGELWRYLFVQHLAGLPEDEQQRFREGRHPSQSHDRVEVAEPVAELLRAELARRGIAAEVSVARYLDGADRPGRPSARVAVGGSVARRPVLLPRVRGARLHSATGVAATRGSKAGNLPGHGQGEAVVRSAGARSRPATRPLS